MFHGPLNTFERLSGGKLHHCCFCRIQFYDRRKLAPRTNVQAHPSVNGAGQDRRVEPEIAEPGATNLPDKAS